MYDIDKWDGRVRVQMRAALIVPHFSHLFSQRPLGRIMLKLALPFSRLQRLGARRLA